MPLLYLTAVNWESTLAVILHVRPKVTESAESRDILLVVE